MKSVALRATSRKTVGCATRATRPRRSEDVLTTGLYSSPIAIIADRSTCGTGAGYEQHKNLLGTNFARRAARGTGSHYRDCSSRLVSWREFPALIFFPRILPHLLSCSHLYCRTVANLVI